MKKTLLLFTTFLTMAVVGAQAVGDTFTDNGINYIITSAFPDPDEVGVVDMDAANVIANVVIPASVTYLSFPFAVVSLEDGAFSAHGTKGAGAKPENAMVVTVSLPTTLTMFNGSHHFRDNPNLTTINLENIVDTGGNTFANCTGLTTVDLSSCEILGDYAFVFCHGLTALEVPNLITMNKGNFYDMDGITTINVPATVTSIGDICFGRNALLTSVQLNWADPSTVPVSEVNFFRNEDFATTAIKLYVPVDTEELYEAHPQWGLFPAANIIEGSIPLSTNKVEQALGLSLYPNPTNGIVNIKNRNNTNAAVTVFDLNGRSLLESTDSRIDISNFAAGLYVVRVKTDEGQLVKRILKN